MNLQPCTASWSWVWRFLSWLIQVGELQCVKLSSLLLVVIPIVFSPCMTSVSHSQQGMFSDIYAFGDSTLDTGNNFAGLGGMFPPSPPYHRGRYSDGELWHEILARELGLSLPTPSLTGGNNFAFGGAQTGLGTSTFGPIPNVGTQINMFRDQQGRFSDDALILVAVGANDIRAGRTPESAISALKGHLQDLHELGGRNFLVSNYYEPILDLGPITELFNAEMSTFSLLDSDLRIYDRAGLIQEILTDPEAYGFSNPVDSLACRDCNLGERLNPTDIVDDPSSHMFFDVNHPTSTLGAIMANRAIEMYAVPEPSTLPTMLAGLILAVYMLRLSSRPQLL